MCVWTSSSYLHIGCGSYIDTHIKRKTENRTVFYPAPCLELWEEKGVCSDLGKWGQTLKMSTWYSCSGAEPELVLSQIPIQNVKDLDILACSVAGRPWSFCGKSVGCHSGGGNVVSPKWLRDGQAKLQARWKMCSIDMLPEDSVDQNFSFP